MWPCPGSSIPSDSGIAPSRKRCAVAESEISALVEKKTGFDGNRTLIQDGLCGWCSAGSIFTQDIGFKLTYPRQIGKFNSYNLIFVMALSPRRPN